MAEHDPSPHPDIHEDMAFTKKLWIFERIGWGFMGVIIFAGVLGFFGGVGPFSFAHTQSEEDGLKVKYTRFNRFQAPGRIEIQVNNVQSSADTISLHFENYLSAFKITGISPQPVQEISHGEIITYKFLSVPQHPLKVFIHLTGRSIGFLSGVIWVDSGRKLKLAGFIYP